MRPIKRVRKIAKKTTKYDSAWKDVIEELFESFLSFLFPRIHRDIDFSKKPVFLNHEFRSIKPYGNLGDRYADVLIKVFLKNGETACIFIHIEVQGNKVSFGVFEKRMYVYNYRIHDWYLENESKVISLAILTDDDEKFRPDEYHLDQWGFDLRMKFPMVKLLDFKNKEEFKHMLATSTNPMAMVVKAQLRCHQLKKADDQIKSTVKYELIRECYANRYPKKAIQALLKFIDWLIRLPDNLANQLKKKIAILEEDYKMPYVTSWERSGKKEGIQIGREDGKREEKLETARKMLMRGYDVDVIVDLLGLKETEVRAMIN